MPTLAIEFIGDNGYGYGTYHADYDSRAYVEKIADPGFEQGVVMARVLGTMALRMSEADVLPFRFSHYATRLEEAIDAAAAWAKDAGPRWTWLDCECARTRWRRPRRHSGDGRPATGRANLPASVLPTLNNRLARMEQRLADDEGAPESKWYRHVFYGWNIYSLYDGQPLPGLAEALRLKDQPRVTREVRPHRARAQSNEGGARRRSRYGQVTLKAGAARAFARVGAEARASPA